jgi:hypothetical protein
LAAEGANAQNSQAKVPDSDETPKSRIIEPFQNRLVVDNSDSGTEEAISAGSFYPKTARGKNLSGHRRGA